MAYQQELVYAINDEGLYLQDLVMAAILGVDKLPEGFEVGFLDGDTLNCTRKNLVLTRKGEGRNAHQ